MITQKRLVSLLPKLLAFEHPILTEIRRVLAAGGVSYTLDTHRDQEQGLSKNQVALRFRFSAEKVPLVSSAPTLDFPLAPLVSDRDSPVSCRLFLVDGWLWRVLFESLSPRFPGLSLLRYSVDKSWDPAVLPILEESNYDLLNKPVHDWIRKLTGAPPNGDPRFQFSDSEDLQSLFQLYRIVDLGTWTWEAPDEAAEIVDLAGENYLPVARDASGNLLGYKAEDGSYWEISHEGGEPVDKGKDLRKLLED